MIGKKTSIGIKECIDFIQKESSRNIG